MNSNNYIEQKKNTHLYFRVGNNQYAINSANVLEIMKLPTLEYPQKLPNNIVGLLKYNNFMINVIDIRFYLNIDVTPYSTHNELLVVRTDETIIGIVTDKVIGILPFDTSTVDTIPFVDNKTIIDSIYKHNDETIFIINIYAVENLLKEHNSTVEYNIQSLFPADDESKNIMKKRTMALVEKAGMKFSPMDFHAKNKFISFILNDNYYCIALDYVKEALKDTLITNIPGTPDFIEGIMNLRGDYITVINLKKFLNLSSKSKPLDKKPVIIIKCNELELALLIDKINELFEIQTDDIPEYSESYFTKEFIYNDNLYTILNIEKITSDKKIIITDI